MFKGNANCKSCDFRIAFITICLSGKFIFGLSISTDRTASFDRFYQNGNQPLFCRIQPKSHTVILEPLGQVMYSGNCFSHANCPLPSIYRTYFLLVNISPSSPIYKPEDCNTGQILHLVRIVGLMNESGTFWADARNALTPSVL